MQNHYSVRPTGQTSPSVSGAPNAALLIDFDNVTMGMRSDLAKELKNLLDSDIIKGKVTVQRAYADWRRYPQYIVPLSEASIDLIFAPAYGSSKKNATDIRMAIDGMELVFIRPEIGTFILLTGDSDFSSLVLKLKEYGKYVIGIGIQESSSDILVQNCDEYYSYTSLTGLSRTSEGGGPEKRDPWQSVADAMARMTERGDVMRSDRLKQVLIEIAPDFDERNLGYRKFSRFLVAAANKGLLRIERGENGQYGVAPADGAPTKASPASKTQGAAKPANGRTAAKAKPANGKPAAKVGSTPKRSRSSSPDERSGTDEGRVVEGGRSVADRGPALDLLRRALREFGDKGREGVRDSDVKRRLLALDNNFDEGGLGFSRFGKFLQFAVDSGAIVLSGLDGGGYEVRLVAEDDQAPAAGRSGRGRRHRGQGRPRDSGRQPDPRRRPAESGHMPAVSGLDAKALGLPTTTDATIGYLAHRYGGVGVKTAKTLVETFGEGLFRVLQETPDEVRALLPRARAERVLSAWKEDYARRTAAEPRSAGGGRLPQSEEGTARARATAAREPVGVGAASDAESSAAGPKKSSAGIMGLFRRRNRGDDGAD